MCFNLHTSTGVVLVLLLQISIADPIERQLMNDVMKNYSTLERPVLNHRLSLVVKVKFILQQIVDVDERNQIITTNAWLDLRWNDYLWKWDPKKYNFLNNTRVPYKHIWTPDIILYNSADKNFDPTTHTSVVVHSNGSCMYIPPGVFKSTCKINVSNFPFDKQNCTLKFGVWSYNGNQVDLQLQEGDGGADTSEYTESGEWRLIKLIAKRNSRKYECCPENFVHVTFTVILQRRTTFYFVNLIIPCILNSILTLLTFFLPAEAAEKITLAITVLLAQIVFMLVIMEAMPPTSDAVPIISKYFACSLFTVCASVAATVLVLSFYYTSPEIDGHLPPWVKNFLLITFPKWMRMKPYSPKSFRRANALYVTNNNKKMHRKTNLFVQQVLEQSSACNPHPFSNSTSVQQPESSSLSEPMTRFVNDHVTHCYLPTTDLRNPQLNQETLQFTSSNDKTENDESEKNKSDLYLSTTKDMECLRQILGSLQKINHRMMEERVHNEILLEWQFASRVLDKILLWIFSIFIVCATIITLFAVPNIEESFLM